MLRIAGYFWPVRPAHYLVVATLAALAPASVSAAPLNGLFKGNAYGGIAHGVPAALAKTLHKVAYRPLPCGGTDGATLQKTANGFSAGPGGTLLTIGTATSTIFTNKTDTSAQMISTSTLDDVSLFGGRVTATRIKSVSIADADPALITTASTGSEFTGLIIDSVPVGNPTPGAQWQLAGIGTVLGGLITFDSITAVAENRFNGSTHVRSTAGMSFSGLKINGQSYTNPSANALHIVVAGYGVVHVNEQVIPRAASSNKMKVNGLRVVIQTVPNDLGLPVGAEIHVAHAEAVADR